MGWQLAQQSIKTQTLLQSGIKRNNPDMHRGYVTLHRKLTEWEWYKCSNTKAVFLHLLLTANYKPSKFMGYDVPIGAVVTGYSALADQLNLSVRNVRTAISHLKKSGVIDTKSTSKFSIISLTNWDTYQICENTSDKQVTSNRQASDKQVTASKEGKKVIKKEIKDFDVPDFINRKKWDALMVIRVAKKAVQSHDALTAIVNKLEKYGDSADESLDNAIENSWKTVYPVKNGDKTNGVDKPFNELLSKVGVVSRMDVPEFTDPLIMPALNKCGGWMQLCGMSTSNIKWDFKPKFMEAYNGNNQA